MKRARISVVMPVHNAAKYVGQALWSIRRQGFDDLEIICVDDGSTDGSARVLARHARRDGRVKVIRQSNQGLVPARNRTLAEAHGQYVAIMDADDIAWPDRLERQVRHLEDDPDCVAVGGWVRMIDPAGWPVGYRQPVTAHDAIDAALLNGGGYVMPQPTVMIRRAALEQVGGYRPAIHQAEDLDLYLRLAEVGSLANLPGVVLDYRLHLKNTSKTKASEQAACAKQVVADACHRRGLAMPALEARSAEMQTETLAQMRENWWWHARHNGFFGSALRQTGALLARRPWSGRLWKQAAGDAKRVVMEGGQRRGMARGTSVAGAAREASA
jgi:glycosyltransferase involved in cell wall biosynthesis